MSISGRCAEACVQHLLPLARTGDTATRLVALNALACCGGAEALAAVKAAAEDKDESLQDEAVRTLSTWANRWPDDAGVADTLLAITKSARKPQHQVLAIRGFLQYIQGAKKLAAQDKLTKVEAILPSITRPEEKRQAIAVLGVIPAAGAGAARHAGLRRGRRR